MSIIFADKTLCVQPVEFPFSGNVYLIVNLPFQGRKLQILDNDLFQGMKKINADICNQRTSLDGNSTILLPSLSSMFFSRRNRTLSRMTCTISMALGSRARNGKVINLFAVQFDLEELWKQGWTHERKKAKSDQGLKSKNFL